MPNQSIPNIPWQATDLPDALMSSGDTAKIPSSPETLSHHPTVSLIARLFLSRISLPVYFVVTTKTGNESTPRIQRMRPWKLIMDPIEWTCNDPELSRYEYRYDPRVGWIEDRYYITWCNGYHGPTIGVGYTFDFEKFHFIENAYLPFNRNGVLFPRKINNRYYMLNRPSDNAHTPFGDIYLSASPDMIHWGEHRYVMES